MVAVYGKNSKNKIPNFELKNPDGNDTWKELKGECKRLLDLHPWDNDYEIAMDSARLWCVSNAVPT